MGDKCRDIREDPDYQRQQRERQQERQQERRGRGRAWEERAREERAAYNQGNRKGLKLAMRHTVPAALKEIHCFESYKDHHHIDRP